MSASFKTFSSHSLPTPPLSASSDPLSTQKMNLERPSPSNLTKREPQLKKEEEIGTKRALAIAFFALGALGLGWAAYQSRALSPLPVALPQLPLNERAKAKPDSVSPAHSSDGCLISSKETTNSTILSSDGCLVKIKPFNLVASSIDPIDSTSFRVTAAVFATVFILGSLLPCILDRK